MRVAAVGLRGPCRDRLHRAEVLGEPGVGRLCRSGLRGRGNWGQLDAPGQRIDKGIHIVALAVGLVTHPIRTLALVFHKLAALAAGLALILALIVWFWYDHSKPDFVPCFWGSIGVIVASILIRTFAEWILERPTRAERRAMKRAAAQETDRVTMCMPVSEEVAAAFESTRDGRRASL